MKNNVLYAFMSVFTSVLKNVFMKRDQRFSQAHKYDYCAGAFQQGPVPITRH